MRNKITKKQKTTKSPLELVKEKGVARTLLKVSLPILALMLADAAYFLFDSLMSSNFVEYSSDQNAGDVLGFVIPYLGLLYSFNTLFVVGTSFAYIKSLANKKKDEGVTYFFNGFFFGFTVMVCIFILIYFSFPAFVNAFSGGDLNLPEVARTDGIQYGRITGISFLLMFIRDHFLRTLRTEGNTITPTFITIISIPINLLLNWVFMDVMKIGLEGAAYATLIASFVSALSILIYWFVLVKTKGTNIVFSKITTRLDFRLLGIILLFGLSSFLRRITTSLHFNSLSIILTSRGENWVQFWNAISKVNNFTSLLSLGITQGAAILYGYFYFTKEKSKVFEISKIAFILTLLIQIIPFILVMSLSTQLMSLFNMSNITQENKSAWYILTSSNLMNSFILVPIGYYSSIKDLKNSMKILLVNIFTLFLPFTWIGYGIPLWSGVEDSQIIFWFQFIPATLSTLMICSEFYYKQKRLINI